MKRSLRLMASNREGATAVEFALLAPILLMLAIGIAKFGIVLNNYIMLTEGVTEGARQLALSRGGATPRSAAVSAVQATANNLASGSLTITTTVNGTTCGTDSACSNRVDERGGTIGRRNGDLPMQHRRDGDQLCAQLQSLRDNHGDDRMRPAPQSSPRSPLTSPRPAPAAT